MSHLVDLEEFYGPAREKFLVCGHADCMHFWIQKSVAFNPEEKCQLCDGPQILKIGIFENYVDAMKSMEEAIVFLNHSKNLVKIFESAQSMAPNPFRTSFFSSWLNWTVWPTAQFFGTNEWLVKINTTKFVLPHFQ